jgi:hypothetical protein
VTAVRERIFQTSDLTGAARREFLELARQSLAHLRAPDGEALVMLRQALLDHLTELRNYILAYLMLDNALSRPRAERHTADFGAWAFVDVFDDDDIERFRTEINDALVRTIATGDATIVEETLRAWRTSASTLADPIARAILAGDDDLDDWVEVDRPSDS